MSTLNIRNHHQRTNSPSKKASFDAHMSAHHPRVMDGWGWNWQSTIVDDHQITPTSLSSLFLEIMSMAQCHPVHNKSSTKRKLSENTKIFGPTQIRTEIKRSRVSYTNPYTMGPSHERCFNHYSVLKLVLWLVVWGCKHLLFVQCSSVIGITNIEAPSERTFHGDCTVEKALKAKVHCNNRFCVPSTHSFSSVNLMPMKSDDVFSQCLCFLSTFHSTSISLSSRWRSLVIAFHAF